MVRSVVKQGALSLLGRAAAKVPNDRARLFAFVSSPEVRAHPWELYQRLHASGPVRQTRFRGAWLVASHAGVSQVVRSPQASVNESIAYPEVDRSGAFAQLFRTSMLFRDPPDHTRLRRLVARAFTPRTVEQLRPHVEELVDDRLRALRPRGSADVMTELALPLPVAVICELLGVPERERPRFLQWATQLAPRLEIDLFRDEQRNQLGDRAAAELRSFLTELVEQPARRHPDGLLSQLVALEDDGDRLTRDEVVSMAALLLGAGFETTTNLIANSLVALLDAPDQLELVRDGDIDPARAVDEFLRFAGPVQFSRRVLTKPLELDGHEILAGTLVALLIGAANRDPLVFDEPDRLDLRRSPNPHLSFSAGIHHCIGHALARLEAEVAIPAIVRGLPDLALAGRLHWRPTFVLRGVTALPLRWS